MKPWPLLGAIVLIACSSKVVLHVKSNDASSDAGGSSSGGKGGSEASGGNGGSTASGGTGAGGLGTAGTGTGGTATGVGGGSCEAAGTGEGWFFATTTEGFSSYGTASALTWVSGGCPTGGALELVIQFTGPGQQAAASITVPPRDLSTGAPMTAWVKMPSGVAEGVATLFLKDANSVYAAGPTVALFPGQDWFQVSGDLQASGAYVDPGFDRAHVIEIGVQLTTPSYTPNQAQTTTLFIDSIAR